MLLASLLLLAPAPAQEGYRLPPPAVQRLVEAEPSPSLDFSPDGAYALVVERDALPSLEDVTRPMLRLAGLRIDPSANGRFQTSFSKGLLVRATGDSGSTRVPLADGARLAGVGWSHDSRRFYYLVVADAGTELWSATVDAPGEPRRLSTRLDTILGGPRWMPDGETLLVREVPENRGAAPPEPRVPRGPNVRETSGDASPLRTYQDLLSSPHDEALFEHYATSELALISTATGERHGLGAPAIHLDAEPSPDGSMLLVTRIERPFSYVMPLWRFPQTIEVRGLDGGTIHTVVRVPLQEGIPIQGVRTGPRNVDWRTGRSATLVWAEALDGGDPDAEAEFRDRWLVLAAPFEGEPRELLRLEHRARGLMFLAVDDAVIAGDYDRDRRWVRDRLFQLDDPDAEPIVLEDRSSRDRYGDPGRIVTRPDASGRRVPMQDGDWIWRTGSGASEEGLLPFLDRQNVRTLATERIWRCEPGSYEFVVELLGEGAFVTRHETPTDPPNYRLRSATGDTTALTSFADPTPEIRGVTQRLVKYERADGVPLSATLYLPADHEAGRRLPLFVWAYPLEYNDPSTAGQVSSSPWRFTTIRGTSHLTLLTQGYAVMDGATMPVIGDPETMNDTFVEQIVSAAAAAIDYAVELGVADRERCAVGGHSYGAFMTANLLAHCDLFRAGIARSGAYNRSLTPFGFQSERRTFWEAPEAYFAVSPFMHADGIDEPLLLVHGEIDSNSGTFPMQSERMYQAIEGHGGTARLVMLPGESHGYRARESVLHVQAEMVDWLDRHLKDAEGRPQRAAREASGR